MSPIPTALLLGLPIAQGLGELYAMRRLGTFARPHRPEWTFFAVNIPYWLLVICALIEKWQAPSNPSAATILVGVALAVSGIAIRMHCHFYLREAFSPFVEPPQSQRLVSSGLYSAIRHPMYLGSLLLLLGLPLIVAAKYAWALSLVAFVGLLFRIQSEEQMLTDHLAGYVDYARTRWRLAPYVW